MPDASKDQEASENAPVLWMLVPSFATIRQLEKLERSRPPRFDFSNRDAVTRNAPPRGRDDAHWFATMPTPRLSIRQAGFAPDFIWAGLYFASARLRAAIGLGADAVEYRDVEMGDRSCDAALAVDYRVFRPVQRADPVDLALTYGQEPDRGPDGEPTPEWWTSVSGPHASPRRTVWKPDFLAPAPLFADARGGLMATEELADRVMAAGLRDVAFLDMTSEASLERPVFRTVSAPGQDSMRFGSNVDR